LGLWNASFKIDIDSYQDKLSVLIGLLSIRVLHWRL